MPSQPISKAIDQIMPLPETRIISTANEVGYKSRYGVRHTGYVSDHRVTGTIVLPTTAELEAATVVGRLHFGTSRVSFDNAMHHQAMSFANGEDRSCAGGGDAAEVRQGRVSNC